MPIQIKVKAADDATRKQREVVAQRVIAHFGDRLPGSGLLCLLDDKDWLELKEEIGPANGGAYTHIGKGTLPPWLHGAPNHVKELLLVDGQVAFDNFIYLHGSACSNEMRLTMTLAHELQHFVQHGTALSLWAANTLIPNLPKSVITALGLTWCDVPHEREARMVSKRVGQDLSGSEAVNRHIEARINEHVTDADAADWERIRGLDTAVPYDLAAETRMLFLRFKEYRGGS